MPTIEISKKDLFNLIGKNLTKKELEEDLMLVKGELESINGNVLKVEIADTNRPDLWSSEGIAREIKTKYGKTNNLSFEKLKNSGLIVKVDKNLKKIRPKTVCAVIKNLKLTHEILSQLIQLQEKICETFGNKRKEVAIGVYDLHKIKGPINYKSFKPNDIKFIPLEFTKKLNLNQILRTHPKGKEYAHLLEEHSQYPLFLDSAGEVLSMPPIINSDYTGKVTEKTKAVFIECSGFEFKYLMPSLNVIVAALVDRGGELQTVKVVYPEKEIVTPNLKLKKIKINWKYIEKRTGLSIGKKNIIKLLKQANYKVKDKGNNLELEYSSIRQDIMHPVDVVEDVTIRYGYNNIEPISPKLITTQKINKINLFNKKIANILIGTGSQEILSYTLTNKNNLIEKMNLKNIKVVEVDNPVSKNWSSFRTWITPCLMEFLSKNTNKEYPQQIFEIGEVVVFDKNAETKTKNPVRVAWAKADKKSDFTDAKQILDFLMNAIGLDYSIEEIKHDSFIEGRVGRVFVKNKSVAYVGEINPKVLSNFRIDMPVCTFELNLTEICKLVKK